jgi:hypothetical protein
MDAPVQMLLGHGETRLYETSHRRDFRAHKQADLWAVESYNRSNGS